MNKLWQTKFSFFVVAGLISGNACAHGGGQDANGGHVDRTTGEYHCHADHCVLPGSFDDVFDPPEADGVAQPEVGAQLFGTVDENAVRAPHVVDAELPVLVHSNTCVQARQTGVVHHHVRLPSPPDGLRLADLELDDGQIRCWDHGVEAKPCHGSQYTLSNRRVDA